MRILAFTTAFYPQIGGIERQVELMAREFAFFGHEVVLATPVINTAGDDTKFPFRVIRGPSARQFIQLQIWCDVHLQMNVSLKYAWPLAMTGRKLVYFHANAYERDDGTRSVLDYVKYAIASRTRGIANSKYTASRVGCKNVVPNPYDQDLFHRTSANSQRSGDLVFLGRLVSQKGCETLIRALGALKQHGLRPQLTLIGSGPDASLLHKLTVDEGVTDQTCFTGALSGESLVTELNRHKIMVVPSEYREPFGIVALEGLACGLLPIVAEKGGLVEAIGPHGLVFPNGNKCALAQAISMALRTGTAERLLFGVEKYLSDFTAPSIAQRYLEVLLPAN